MTPRQREKLLDIGFSFEKKFYNSYSFSDVYKALQTFYDTHVSHQVPHSYVDETGCPIGKISYEIRYHKRKISPKQWKALNDIGFMWTSEREELPFEEKLHLLEAYKAEYGHVNVPQKYVTDDGDPLGEIVHLIRQQTALPKEEVDALNGLGFVWKNNERRTYPFYMVLSMFQEYFQQHGNFDIPITYKTKEGYPLGSINYGIRTGHRKTSKEQKEALEQIGYRF